jgi:hypothetical protein
MWQLDGLFKLHQLWIAAQSILDANACSAIAALA